MWYYWTDFYRIEKSFISSNIEAMSESESLQKNTVCDRFVPQVWKSTEFLRMMSAYCCMIPFSLSRATSWRTASIVSLIATSTVRAHVNTSYLRPAQRAQMILLALRRKMLWRYIADWLHFGFCCSSVRAKRWRNWSRSLTPRRKRTNLSPNQVRTLAIIWVVFVFFPGVSPSSSDWERMNLVSLSHS